MPSSGGEPVIVGAFHGPSGRTGQRALDLYVAAAAGALADAGMGVADVDALLTSYSWESPVLMHADAVAEHLGVHARLTETVCLGGASPCGMLGRAAAAIRAGACETAVLASASNRASGLGREAAIDALREVADPQYELPYGAFVPALYALVANRHMHDYGTSGADLARIAVAQRAHAARNPEAELRDPITVDEVLASKVIAAPLHMLDCCLVTDFCAGLVVTTQRRAQLLARAGVPVLGYGEAHSHLTVSQAPDRASEGMARSAAAAFAQARLSPAEVSFAELYDCFTITVLTTLEDLGFCARGEAGRFAADGHFGPGGSLPVNTYGGMLSGATGGMYHLTEAVTQLRGEAGERQVTQREAAVVTGVGGVFSASCAVVLGGAVLGGGDP